LRDKACIVGVGHTEFACRDGFGKTARAVCACAIKAR
jgi:hypothetical protein